MGKGNWRLTEMAQKEGDQLEMLGMSSEKREITSQLTGALIKYVSVCSKHGGMSSLYGLKQGVGLSV